MRGRLEITYLNKNECFSADYDEFRPSMGHFGPLVAAGLPRPPEE